MKRKILCLLLILSSTLQLNAQCTNYAGIEITSTNGQNICSGTITPFSFTILTNGAPVGESYNIEMVGSNGWIDSGSADDSGSGAGFFSGNAVEGCDRLEIFIDFTIICDDTGEILDNVTEGPFFYYPALLVETVPPGCNEGENGYATLITFDREICQGPVEGVPGVCGTQQEGTLSYNFTTFENTPCSFEYAEDITVSCVDSTFGCVECPRPFPGQFPRRLCEPSTNEYCFTFNGDISEIDSASVNFQGLGGTAIMSDFNIDENQICFIYTTGLPLPCDDITYIFSLSYSCPNLEEDLSIPPDFLARAYPGPSYYEITIEPSTECGGVPTILPPECGNLIIGEIVPPINDCDNPVAGIIPYVIELGFSPAFGLPGPPDCFTSIPLEGEVLIEPCLENCCNDLDLTVLTDNLACDINGTPQDPTDELVVSIDITITGGVAGTMWTADDGMGNTFTGTYGVATTLTPTVPYPLGTVLNLVITDISNPDCSTTVDVTLSNCTCPRPLPLQFPSEPFCSPSTNEYCFTFGGDISEIDPNSILFEGFSGTAIVSEFNINENQICFSYTANINLPCDYLSYLFSLSYSCPNVGEDLFFPPDFLIEAYPGPSYYEITIEPSPECGGVPTILPPECGNLIIGDIVLPINDCDNPVAGVIPYTIELGFSPPSPSGPLAPPDCFTNIPLEGEILIEPCLQDCCNDLDLTVVTNNFACDNNGTPEDPIDDVVGSIDITVTGGAAGTMWTADDGMGNTITGTYSTATTLTPTVPYPAGTVLNLVITDTSNPSCNTTVDVTINCIVTENVPTLGEWSLIILTLLMSIVATVGIRQQSITVLYQEKE